MTFKWIIFSGFMVLMIFVPTNANLIDNFITEMEQAIIKTTYNCTAIKTYFGLQYYQLINQTQPDIPKLSLIFHRGNETINLKLTDPFSQLFETPEYNKSLPITIYVHGFQSTQTSNSVKQMIAALLKRGGTNVFALDTGSLVEMKYLRASTNVMIIGKLLGQRLAEYVNGGVDRRKIHIIGHSLGAHIAGLTGKTFNSLTGFKIGRISGLDPAGPCFFSSDSGSKLYKTDADFVDVIHSDSGVLGITEPLGHVDFYPNNGENQPNALIPPEGHRRAWRTYIESILSPNNFLAVICPNWRSFLLGFCSLNPRIFMGYDVPITAQGIYFLRTNGSSPFGLGHEGSLPEPKVVKNWYEAYFARFG